MKITMKYWQSSGRLKWIFSKQNSTTRHAHIMKRVLEFRIQLSAFETNHLQAKRSLMMIIKAQSYLKMFYSIYKCSGIAGLDTNRQQQHHRAQCGRCYSACWLTCAKLKQIRCSELLSSYWNTSIKLTFQMYKKIIVCETVWKARLRT